MSNKKATVANAEVNCSSSTLLFNHRHHSEGYRLLPVFILHWVGPVIQHHELGVCGGGGVLCSGSLGTFRLMFDCLLSSLHPPSLPFLPSVFSLFCLHSLRARDMNTSKSNRRSFCFTGRGSKQSSFTGWVIEEVEDRG